MSQRSNVIPPRSIPPALSAWSLIDRTKAGRFYRIEATFRERFVLKMISSRSIRGDAYTKNISHTRKLWTNGPFVKWIKTDVLPCRELF